ncbi:MAG TPA: hypothetical protein VFV38_09025 [Ktedonobacteraceae bacterium]|nr:hypothetical protein [Ktedonobacteraceae bacterium]
MANTEKNEKYVTELAGPDDRWLSVTDAARITRRQEKSVRDWVESGKLPVNPERTGLNKRTRLVRLSDLQTLTPIVDPDAGISTDVGLLDLPNIPKAQQRLTEQMTALQQEVGERFAGLDAQLGTLTTQQEQQHQDLLKTIKFQADLHDGQLREAQAKMNMELQQVRAELIDLVTQGDQALRLWVVEQVGQSEARLREDVSSLVARLNEIEQVLRTEQAEAVERLKKSISALGTHLVESLQGEHDRTSEAIQARQVAHDQLQVQSDERYTETHRQLTQLQGAQAEQDAATSRRLTELAEGATALDKRIAGQATELSQLATTWQRRAEEAEREARQLRTDLDGQAKNQQTLQKQLDEERKAREALAKQVEKLLQQGKKEKA